MNRVKYWSIISLPTLMTLLLFCDGASAFPRGVNWRQMKTDHFIIVFLDQHRDIAKHIAGMAESLHQEMAPFFQYTDAKKIYVVVTDYIDRIDRLTIPAARSTSKDRIVLLLGDPLSSASSFALPAQQWVNAQFIYQYTNIMRHRMDGSFRFLLSFAFPSAGFAGWMDGGMGLYMVLKLQSELRLFPFFNMLMRTELLDNNFVPLGQQTAAGSREWPGDLGLFLYGYSFLLYLTETYGEDRLEELTHLQNKSTPNPFSPNKTFEKIYGKTLQELQQEWSAELQGYYQKQVEGIRQHSLTLMTPLSDSGYFTGSPVFSPDGEFVYYIEDDPHQDQALVQLRLADKQKIRLTEGNFSGELSLSSDGQQIYFSKTDYYKIYYQFSDLYMLELSTRKVTRLTRGERAFDPAISPDEKSLVYVSTNAGTMTLKTLDLDTGQRSVLLAPTGVGTQIRHPSFSSDGRQLVLQMLQMDGKGGNIYLMNSDGTNLRPLIDDDARDTSPSWGMQNDYLFFTSDRSGVPNIFAYSFKQRGLYQVTNVLTGALNASVSMAGDGMVFEHYSSRGTDVYLTELNPQSWIPVNYMPIRRAQAPERSQEVTTSPETGYRSFPSLFSLPLILPSLGTDEDGYQLGLYFSGSDILKQQEYSLLLLYGLSSSRLEFDAEYRYNRFNTKFGLFGYNRSEKYAYFFKGPEDKDDRAYWQARQGGGVFLWYPFYKSRETDLVGVVEYEYRKLSDLSQDKVEVEIPEPDLGVLSDVAAALVWKRFNRYRYSISPESGFLSYLEYKKYDEALGGDYNIDAVSGDLRLFINSFFQHHVFFLRGAGGYSQGDQLTQGTFQLGGYFFQVQSDVLSKPVFYLRGYDDRTFRGDRFVLGSAEYRFPLWYVEHSTLNGLLYWNNIAMTLFVDAGDAWDNETRDMKTNYGAGGELNLNVGYWYGKIPVKFDIGVAYGFDEVYGETRIYFRMRAETFSY